MSLKRQLKAHSLKILREGGVLKTQDLSNAKIEQAVAEIASGKSANLEADMILVKVQGNRREPSSSSSSGWNSDRSLTYRPEKVRPVRGKTPTRIADAHLRTPIP